MAIMSLGKPACRASYKRVEACLVVLNLINCSVDKSPQDLGAVVWVEQDVIASPDVAQLQAILLHLTEQHYFLNILIPYILGCGASCDSSWLESTGVCGVCGDKNQQ